MATMETGEVSSVVTPRFTSDARESLDRHPVRQSATAGWETQWT
ncbi:MAG TPA: hypothetical protein VF391_00290 [Dermatophilaceae bacterium]|jgi:hypothetical protein